MVVGSDGYRTTSRGHCLHTTSPSMTIALGSIVIAPKPVTSWIKSLFKGDFFSLLFLLQWSRSARNNKSCNGLNASGKLPIAFPSLYVISQPKYSSHINVNENLHTHNVRCVTRGMCPAWKVSHKWENCVRRLQSTAYSNNVRSSCFVGGYFPNWLMKATKATSCVTLNWTVRKIKSRCIWGK